MSKVSVKECKVIRKYYKNFPNLIIRALKNKIKSAAKGEFTCFIDKVVPIYDFKEYQDKDTTVYKIEAKAKEHSSAILIQIPNEAVSFVANIMIGADSSEASNALNEVLINATNALMGDMFHSIQTGFVEIFDTKLSIDQKTKEPISYEDMLKEFDTKIYDCAINYDLSLAIGRNYKIKVFTNSRVALSQAYDLRVSAPISVIFSDAILKNMENIKDVDIEITAILGDTKVRLDELLRFDKGSIAQLDVENTEHVRVFANEIEIAKAKVVAVDGNWGIQITDILELE